MESIWEFEHNEAIETEKVDLKSFKPVGKFFEDATTLIKLFGVKEHPALRESSYYEKKEGDELQQPSEDQVREVTALNFYKYRLDRATLRITFMCLPSALQIQTLKFSNNGLTHAQMSTLIKYLSEEQCPVQNLFLDWNPIYTDEFQAGSHANNKLYQLADATEEEPEEQSLFAKLIQDAKKLQVLFLRSSGLKDRDLRQICHLLKPDAGALMNKTLKVLDLSYNDFSSEAVRELNQVFETNRSLEYLGLAKNNLNSDDVCHILKSFGKVAFDPSQVESHQAELKKRDQIIEANKKKKQQKKPEDPVPVLDDLECVKSRDSEGNEVTNWFLVRCPQFKHLNLCLNNLEDDVLADIKDVLNRTPDDFGFTLSGNPISKDLMKELHSHVEALHKQRNKEIRMADPNAEVFEIKDVAQKRAAF